jgi:hypothetical protein
MHDESAALMRGTSFEDSWYFYHGDLSLITAKSCMAWMKERQIQKQWLLPQGPCNKGTTYEGRPIGNTPEVMSLDTTLNRDLHESTRKHVVVTGRFDNEDGRKFDMSTPKRGSSA